LQARQRAHIAVQLATEIEYKIGRTAAIRAQAVAAFDLGLLDEAWSGFGEALQLARQLGAAEEIIAAYDSTSARQREHDAAVLQRVLDHRERGRVTLVPAEQAGDDNAGIKCDERRVSHGGCRGPAATCPRPGTV